MRPRPPTPSTLSSVCLHRRATLLEGRWGRTAGLLAIDPNHLVMLTPGCFWYLVVIPRGMGKVHMVFSGGLRTNYDFARYLARRVGT